MSTKYLTNVNGTLYFTIDDIIHGNELWTSDGTSTGTRLLADRLPGASIPSNLLAVGNTLYYPAFDDATGRELHRTTPGVAAASTTADSGTYFTGNTIPVTLTFSEPVTLNGGALQVTLNSGAVLTIAPFSGNTVAVPYVVQAGDTTPRLDVTAFSLTASATLIDALNYPVSLELPFVMLSTQSNLIINPLPPTTVNMVTVNLGAVQRSRVTSVMLNFSAPVDAARLQVPGAITLMRVTGGPTTAFTSEAVAGAARIMIAPATGLVTTVTLTFDNAGGTAISAAVEYGSLADGRWQLSIPYLNYASKVVIRRLFGDENADGIVDGNDRLRLGNAFGSANTAFDINGNGIIDGSDVIAFGNRFGMTN